MRINIICIKAEHHENHGRWRCSDAAFPDRAFTATGLNALPLHAQALVTGLLPAHDAQSHSVLLRLLEIGFLPGETVRVVARGGMGGDPMAVRVGQVTFALRHQEASMVQVKRVVQGAS